MLYFLLSLNDVKGPHLKRDGLYRLKTRWYKRERKESDARFISRV
jgi:hypothetical protein